MRPTTTPTQDNDTNFLLLVYAALCKILFLQHQHDQYLLSRPTYAIFCTETSIKLQLMTFPFLQHSVKTSRGKGSSAGYYFYPFSFTLLLLASFLVSAIPLKNSLYRQDLNLLQCINVMRRQRQGCKPPFKNSNNGDIIGHVISEHCLTNYATENMMFFFSLLEVTTLTFSVIHLHFKHI